MWWQRRFMVQDIKIRLRDSEEVTCKCWRPKDRRSSSTPSLSCPAPKPGIRLSLWHQARVCCYRDQQCAAAAAWVQPLKPRTATLTGCLARGGSRSLVGIQVRRLCGGATRLRSLLGSPGATPCAGAEFPCVSSGILCSPEE
jgi:hypothetical protein